MAVKCKCTFLAEVGMKIMDTSLGLRIDVVLCVELFQWFQVQLLVVSVHEPIVQGLGRDVQS